MTTDLKQIVIEALPEMADFVQWGIWRKGKVKPDGKFPKYPLSPHTGESITGSHENGDYLKKAGSFQQALDAQKKFKADGIGFVLSKDDPFVGIDIDGCLGGGDPGELVETLERFDSYTEVSPSGKGIRILCKGRLPDGALNNPDGSPFEVYEKNRFLTITGDVYGELKPVREAQEAVQWYCEHKTGIKQIQDKPAKADKPNKTLQEIAKDLERAGQALKHVPADNYQTWLDMGFALHSTGAGDFAFDVWDQWSRTSAKYDERSQLKTWQSTKGREGGITLGTLFEKAKQHGWENGQSKIENSQNERPQVYIKGGNLHDVVDQAERVLLKTDEPIYQRGPSLIRPAIVEAGTYHGVERKGSTPILQPVDSNYLRDCLTRHADWKKHDARSKEWRKIDCPKSISDTLLSRVGQWNIPYLRAIIEAPTLRPDGSILDQPGFDQKSGLLFIPNGDFFPIPHEPTVDEIISSIEAINDLLSTFPFVSQEDKAVAVSALLTALVRRSIHTAPIHAFSSPSPGTGKSLIADCCSMVATGKPVAVISQGESDEETEKRLHTALLQGDAVTCLDNIDRPLKGDTLCQMLTQTTIRVRILGKSQTIDCPSTATMFATGNNLTIAGDVARRALLCKLDAGCERPEERKFERNLYEFVRENRAKLVRAGLIILRDYQVAGCPDMGLTPMGSFEQWSRWIRGALVWTGFGDPYLTREKIREADPIFSTVRNFFHAWHAVFIETAAPIKDAIQESQDNSDLRQAIEAIANTRNGINSRVLGRWLSKHQDQIVDGFRLVKGETKSGVAQWRVTES